MKNIRKYGDAPFNIAVIHGGPGAPGEMAPVAKELSKSYGVLEPLQTKMSIEGQLQELEDTLVKYGNPPIILIGYSWGAILSFIFAAKKPSLVKKLILISSGIFEDKYAANIMKTRLNRMTENDHQTINTISENLKNPNTKDKNKLFNRLGEIISKADSYDPLPHKSEIIECQYDIFENVWEEAKSLRRSGKLPEFGRKIKCPVVAIHGDYDPHPVEGIKTPLSDVLNDLKFILIENCGHHPWIERKAKDKFFNILKKELC